MTTVVCNYAVAGNSVKMQTFESGNGPNEPPSESMYEKGASCSACPQGYTCDDGLCAGTGNSNDTQGGQPGGQPGGLPGGQPSPHLV